MKRYSRIMSLSSTALVMFSTPVLAQTPPADAVDSSDIIVTAQRRSESLLNTPLAISATKGETLVKTGIADITSLRFSTPGFMTLSGVGFTQIYIRGIGNRILIGADPSVATFVDDVPRVYGALVDNLANVERVEVLKGAQGGLYGRNATGGVLNIITRQPSTDRVIAEGRVSYGQKKTFNANVFVNIPLNENVAINFVGLRESHDDYVKNLATANPYQSYASLSATQAAALGDTGQRAYLLANPNLAKALDNGSKVSRLNSLDRWYVAGKIGFQGDGFTVTLSGDYNQDGGSNGNGWQNQNPAKTYAVYRSLMSTTGNLLFGSIAPTGPAILPAAYVNPPQGKFESLGSIEHHSLIKDYGVSARADVDLPGMTLSSITAFRWNNGEFRGDVGISNVPLAGFVSAPSRRFVYQELRMVSTNDGPFTWLGGATYFHENVDYAQISVVLGQPLSTTRSTTTTTAFSGYAQGEYSVTDRLKFIASLRYISEKKGGFYPAQTVTIFNFAPDMPVAGRPMGLVPGVAVPAVSVSDTLNKLLPSATISYGLEGGGNIYIRWARGLKTGGVNPLVHPAQTLGTINAFKPEEVDTYEAGYKTNLFNRKVQLSSAIFYNDFRNLQVTRAGYTGLSLVMLNAGRAKTYGGELSVDWRVSPIFNISANMGYLHARYTDFKFAGIPQLQVGAFDLSGNTMLLAPKWQGSVTASVDKPISANLNVAGTLLYSYISKYFTTDDNNPIVAQKGYSLVNARIGVHTADQKYGLYLAVKNMFNKHYAVYGTSSGTSDYIIPGAPRIISGQLEVKF